MLNSGSVNNTAAIQRGRFVNVSAHTIGGGGIHVALPGDAFADESHCQAEQVTSDTDFPFANYSRVNTLDVSDCQFLQAMAGCATSGGGGGMTLRNGFTLVRNCLFRECVTGMGSAMYTRGTASLSVRSTTVEAANVSTIANSTQSFLLHASPGALDVDGDCNLTALSVAGKDRVDTFVLASVQEAGRWHVSGRASMLCPLDYALTLEKAGLSSVMQSRSVNVQEQHFDFHFDAAVATMRVDCVHLQTCIVRTMSATFCCESRAAGNSSLVAGEYRDGRTSPPACFACPAAAMCGLDGADVRLRSGYWGSA